MTPVQEEYIRKQLDSARTCEEKATDIKQVWYWRGWQDALKMAVQIIDNEPQEDDKDQLPGFVEGLD